MIIFDLDGTLADCEHRLYFVDPSKNKNAFIYENKYYHLDVFCNHQNYLEWKPNWNSFYEACDQDVPIEAVSKIFGDLAVENEIEIWSGRCESVREKTIKWLYDYIPYSGQKLKMRPIGDSTPDDILKESWLHKAIGNGQQISFVFDDRPKVVRMWRRRGIYVFNCLQHDKEF